METGFLKWGYKSNNQDRRYKSKQTETQEKEEQQKFNFWQYNSRANKIKQIINNNLKIVETDPWLKDVFPSTHAVSSRRAATIEDKMAYSYSISQEILRSPGLTAGHKVFFLKCGRCDHCNSTLKKTAIQYKALINGLSTYALQLKAFLSFSITVCLGLFLIEPYWSQSKAHVWPLGFIN